jgi:hypothetical protein
MAYLLVKVVGIIPLEEEGCKARITRALQRSAGPLQSWRQVNSCRQLYVCR